MNKIVKVSMVLAVVAVIATGSLAFAKKPSPVQCPRDIYCLDLWDPVLCADGIVYSNMCYAYRECAQMPCVQLYEPPVLPL